MRCNSIFEDNLESVCINCELVKWYTKACWCASSPYCYHFMRSTLLYPFPICFHIDYLFLSFRKHKSSFSLMCRFLNYFNTFFRIVCPYNFKGKQRQIITGQNRWTDEFAIRLKLALAYSKDRGLWNQCMTTVTTNRTMNTDPIHFTSLTIKEALKFW